MGYLTMSKRVLAYVLTVAIILMGLRFAEEWRHPKGILSQSQNTPPQPGDPVARVGLVVSSRKADDTSWIYPPFPEWDKFVYVLDDEEAAHSVPANKGLSAMAYLTHIIEHYDHLHEITIFHHASRYQWHNDDPQYDARRLLTQLNIPYVIEKGYHNLRCVWKLGCGHDAIRLDSTLSHALGNPAADVGENAAPSPEDASPELDGSINKRQQKAGSGIDFVLPGEDGQNDEMNGGDQDWRLAANIDDSEKNDEMNGGDHNSNVASDVDDAVSGIEGDATDDVTLPNDDVVGLSSLPSPSSSRWTTSFSPIPRSSSSLPAASTTAADTAFDSPTDSGPSQANEQNSEPTILPSASSQSVSKMPPIPTIPAGPAKDWNRNTTFRDAFQVLLPGAPVPHSISAPCCAQFAVTRDTIRQRPKAHYQRYREWLIQTDLEDEISSRVMEKLWHIIFGRPANDCPDAPTCYCKLYGLCDLECESNRSCWSQWSSPGNAANDGDFESR